MELNNFHLSHSHGTSLTIVAPTDPATGYPPASTVGTPSLHVTPTVPWLARREESSCAGKENSAECETPVHTNVLAISLGIVIPLVGAIIVLVYLHFRHIKKLKKEAEDDKDIDVENDDFDPQEFAGMQSQNNVYPMNPGEKGSYAPSLNSHLSKNQVPPRLGSPSPFQTPYQLPELSSSQRSLNNYDPYDVSAYPPSGVIYQSPKYPASVYTRTPSPESVVSNPYSDSHQLPYGTGSNYSQQALNPSSTSLNMAATRNLPKLDTTIPAISISRGSSRMSSVSARTPVVETIAAQHSPLPATATVGHYGSTSISTLPSNDEFSSRMSSEQQATDVSVPDDDDDESRHKRIEKKLDFEIHELESIKTTNSYNDYNHESENQTGTAITTDGTTSVGLQRSLTKGGSDFERVKSFYKEYFPKEMKSPELSTENTPEIEAGNFQPLDIDHSQGSSPVGQNDDQHHGYDQVHDYDQHHYYEQEQQYDQHNQSTHEQYSESNEHEFVQQPMTASGDQEGHYPSHDQYYQQTSQNEYYESSEEQYHQDLQEKYYQTSQDEYQQASQGQYQQQQPQAQYYQEAQNERDLQQHHPDMASPASMAASPQTVDGYHGEHLAEPRLSPPKSASQQSFRFIQQLPELSALPTPHKLGDTDSSISYAPQRRNNQVASPSIGIYNPLNSPISFDDKHLGSPSQLRQSVAMIAPGGFLPPKKYQNRNRSDSFGEVDELGTLRSASAASRGPSRQRPPSELVPNAESQLSKLKPTMNMVIA